jgi:hypothetical protein
MAKFLVSMSEFIQKTNEAIRRYDSGKATANDLAQLRYAKQYRPLMVSSQENEQVVTRAAGLAEDIENYGTTYCSQCGGVCNGGH